MKNKVLVSIITPIYNGEKYLKEMIDSVVNQSFTDFELLLINDGSTDSTDEICKKYSTINDNIKYFYKENTGVSDTRNYGIMKSLGKYICFVDSDDILDREFLNNLVNRIIDSDYGMVCCDFLRFTDDQIPSIDCSNNETVFLDKMKYELLNSRYGGYLCNKLYIRKIIIDNNILFDKNIKMCEDMLFIFEYLKHINAVICYDSKDYYYRMLKSSASKNLKNVNWFSIFNVFDKLIENRGILLDETFKKFLFSYYIYLYQGQYRLKYLTDISEKSNLKKLLIKKNNELKKIDCKFTIYQNIKIFIYRYFNSISFYFKLRKDMKI